MKEEDMSESLGTALPAQMARVRYEILPIYDATPYGHLAAGMMRRDLDAAAKSLAEGDVVEMIRVYQLLKDWQA